MDFEKVVKASFTVIGREGSTADGAGFIQKLWQDANAHFEEIAALALYTGDGKLPGMWGLMSDTGRSFMPWEDNFSKGLYLAGVEVKPGSKAPKGWTAWSVPGFEYFCCEAAGSEHFSEAVEALHEQGLEMAGAAFDFTDLKNGKDYTYFPVKKL